MRMLVVRSTAADGSAGRTGAGSARLGRRARRGRRRLRGLGARLRRVLANERQPPCAELVPEFRGRERGGEQGGQVERAVGAWGIEVSLGIELAQRQLPAGFDGRDQIDRGDSLRRPAFPQIDAHPMLVR